MEIIKAENVSYEYKQYEGAPMQALAGVSFSVQEGEFLALCCSNVSCKHACQTP